MARALRGFVSFTVFTFGLAACGGGGGGGEGSSTPPNSGPPTQVTISGVAGYQPLSAATVELLSLGGATLATTQSDANGTFSFSISDSDISGGYELRARDGDLNGSPFAGEMTAFYAAAEDRSNANVTSVTTLISRLVTASDGAKSISARDAVIEDLERIGVVTAASWSAITPDRVDVNTLQRAIDGGRFEEVIGELVGDLTDNDLSAENMIFFPGAHGGIARASIGIDNSLSSFPDLRGTSSIQVVKLDESISLNFALIEGPTWVQVDSAGIVTFDVPANAPSPALEKIKLLVSNASNDLGREIGVELYVIAGDIVAERTIDSNGGVVYDPFGDVAAQFPIDAVTNPTRIRLFRGRDEAGDVAIGVDVDGQLLIPYSLHIVSPSVLEANTPGQLGASASSAPSEKSFDGSSLEFATSASANCVDIADETLLKECWSTYVAAFDRWLADKRLPSGGDRYDGFIRSTFVSVKVAAQLQSRLDRPAAANSGKQPVLFVHGYLAYDPVFNHEGFGGTAKTWGRFREYIDETYLPFEFRWKSDARFQDVADDLGSAIEEIEEITGKRVHVVAHSFGGILVRTLLQDLATSGVDASSLVASLTTIGTPHSGIFRPPIFEGTVSRESASRPRSFFPNGQDSLLIRACGQLSCYQMGEREGIRDDLLDRYALEDTPGSIAHGLFHTRSQLRNSGIPVFVLIGLTTDKGLDDEKVDSGDALISYEGQRFAPDLTVNQSTGEAYGPERAISLTIDPGPQVSCETKLVEAVLGYGERDVRPGQTGFAQPEPAYKYGFRHSNEPRWRGSAKEVNIECDGGSSECAHDTWVRTSDFLSNRVACGSEPATVERILMSVTVVDENGVLLEGVALEFTINGRVASTDGTILSLADGPVSVALPFQAESSYRVNAIPPEGSGYRAASLPSSIFSGISQATTQREFPTIKLVRSDAGLGALTGFTRDADSRELIAGVTYSLAHASLPARQGTASDGTFLESDLPPGMYELSASLSGYVAQESVLCYVEGSSSTCEILLECATVDCGPDVTPPTAPSNVVASGTSEIEILVSWSAASDDVGVQEYDVYRDGALVLSTTNTNATDFGLAANTNYCYTVAARDAAGNVSASTSPPACASTLPEPDTVRPSAPANVNITVDSSTQLSISWSAATDNVGVVEYQIYRDSAQISTSTALSFSDSNLNAGTEYCYAITAKDAAGNESDQSQLVCATTSSGAPTFNIAKILDTRTQLLNGDVFECAGVPLSAVGNGKVVFPANSLSFSNQVLYVWDNGTIRRIVGEQDLIPDGGGFIFGRVTGAAVDGERIYFSGTGGVFQDIAGAISVVAKVGDETPRGGGGTYGAFMGLDASNGVVTFSSASSTSIVGGIYRSDANGISIVADTSTNDPGKPGNFSGLSLSPITGGGLVVFSETVQEGIDVTYQGIYVHDGTDLSLIANLDTALPQPQDSLFSSSALIDSNGRVLFEGADDLEPGVSFYTWLTGSTTLFAGSPRTTAGEGAEFFDHLTFGALDANRLATFGDRTVNFERRTGVYLYDGGSPILVTERTDIIDGKLVFDVWPVGFDGDLLIVYGEFVDGTCGIYSIDLLQ